MSMINEVGEQIKNAFNSTNLKFATRDARSESEAIKMRVRDKMTKITEENKDSSDYVNLTKVHDKIEANHDAIYLRPENGVSASQAVDDCEELLLQQEELEVEFNIAFAALTADPAIIVETDKLQAERKARDAVAEAQQTKEGTMSKADEAKDAAIDAAKEAKENTVAKANEVSDAAKEKATAAKEHAEDKANEVADATQEAAENAKENVVGWKENLTDKAHDVGDRIGDTFEGVKEAVKSPKPRP
jgi:gas vesicle protein